ncbi:1405_t:CDS:1, partial [Funneliformis mosseae]
MGKNPKFTIIERAQRIGLYKSDYRKFNIIRIINQSESTVRTIIQRYGDSDEMLNKKRSDQPS